MFRPRKRRSPGTVPTATGGGEQVRVAGQAVQGVSAGSTGLAPQRTMADHLSTVGYEGVCKAARDAGRTPPSERTFRRWRQQDRVPDAATADLVSRRAHIASLGGVDRAAAALGRSPGAVYDWQSGRTHSLKPDARQRLDDQAARQRFTDSGLDPARRPIIRFTADVHARTDGGDYDFRSRKTFEFGTGVYDREPMPFSDVLALNRALALGDSATVTSILEEHASLRYALFDDYGNDVGIHFDSVGDLTIEWPR